MPAKNTDNKVGAGDTKSVEDLQNATADDRPATIRPREIGGRQGPDPVRYGDWEKAGRCIDF